VANPQDDIRELLTSLDGEFQIIRKLGQGAMGTVFLAREISLRRLVAIKVPRPQLARDEVVRKRFEREAQAAAKIQHRSAAAIHRIGRLPGDIPYLVIEYIDGRTLDQVIQAEGPFGMEAGISILQQIASALEAAHKEGVVHRDVRPANVFFETETSRAVLGDFGIAGILETGGESVTRLTQAGQILGDPAHTSPEQLQGEEVTEATDIYSLGVMGFEVLTAERPYDVTTRAQLITAHLRQEPRDLSRLLPTVDPRLQDLLEKCLAKTPEHRPSAARVREVLEQIQRGPAEAEAAGKAVGGNAVAQHVPAIGVFLEELKRRRVGRVAISYVVVWAVILGAGEIASSGLDIVERTYTMWWAVALAGFPLTLTLSWIFDWDASGIHLTESKSPGSGVGVRVLQFTVLALSIAAAWLIWTVTVQS
jgi:tRNA A-37 threonylcarbamoyl transferase component Bud32